MKFINHASGSQGNLYSVISGNTKILIECGLPIKKIRELTGYKLSEYSACFVSHEHTDHFKCPVDISQIMQLFHEHSHLSFYVANCLKITAIYLDHIVPCFGFLIDDRIDRLLFAVDTASIKYNFTGLTMLAIECNHQESALDYSMNPAKLERIQSHMSLERVKEFIIRQDMSRVREIHLLHLSNENADADFFKNEIAKLTGVPVYV